MLKQVTVVLAFLALVAAAPQFPLYHPYPMYNPYMTVPVLRSPVSPYHFMPYPISYASHISNPVRPQQYQQDSLPTTRIGGTSNPANSLIDYDDNSISLELAEKLLTPEQLRLLEETVAAMNPLEYAARLEATNDPEEAIRLFNKSRN